MRKNDKIKFFLEQGEIIYVMYMTDRQSSNKNIKKKEEKKEGREINCRKTVIRGKGKKHC